MGWNCSSREYCHNVLLGLGREDDWAFHNIEHELIAIYDVAHGASNKIKLT